MSVLVSVAERSRAVKPKAVWMHATHTHRNIFTNCLLLCDSPGQRAFIKHLLLSEVNVLKRQRENNEKISFNKNIKKNSNLWSEKVCANKHCWKKLHLIFSIKLITRFEPWCVQSPLVVLQSLGTKKTKVRRSDRGQAGSEIEVV